MDQPNSMLVATGGQQCRSFVERNAADPEVVEEFRAFVRRVLQQWREDRKEHWPCFLTVAEAQNVYVVAGPHEGQTIRAHAFTISSIPGTDYPLDVAALQLESHQCWLRVDDDGKIIDVVQAIKPN